MNVLKTKIELRYGKTITFSAECNKLASHIYHAIGVKISAQTLRRVLGFINDGSKPGKSTLKVICDYCNIEHVEELFSNNEPKLSAIDIEQINFLKSFYDIDLSSDYDFNYHKACGNIARKIINQPNYLEALSGFLTKSPVGQIFFFERFPYIDGITGDYKKYFKRYVQSKKKHEA